MTRFDEERAKGLPASLETTLAEMKVRDERDTSRAAAPLKQADDAHLIDSTGLTLDEVLGQLIERIQKRYPV